MDGPIPEVETSTPETKFTDLPDELLIPIFDLLTTESLNTVRQLGDRWKNLIDEEIGSEVIISDSNEQRYSIPPEDLRNEVIKICHVRMVESVPPLKKPEKLQILYFKAPVSACTVQNLTNNATNLSKMYFLLYSLTATNISKVGSFDLPNLKILHLCDRSLESGDSTNPGYLPYNITFFLRQSFPSLVEFVLSIVSDRMSTAKFAVKLLYFVQQHYKTLRTLKFNVASMNRGLQLFVPAGNEEFDSVELTQEERRKLDWDKLNKVSLRNLELEFGKNFMIGLSEWRRILETQNLLKSIFIFKEAPVPQLVFHGPIIQSCQNLVYVQIGVQIVDEDNVTIPVDCSLFEVCTGLRKFGLCGNGLPDRPLEKEIINCNKLPRTILALLLKNIAVESTDLETMVFQMRNAVKITLDGVGNKENFGMTLRILDKVMKTKKCMEMIIKTFNNTDAVDFPGLMNEFEKESFTISKLPSCHFHAKFKEELGQYIFICV